MSFTYLRFKFNVSLIGLKRVSKECLIIIKSKLNAFKTNV